MVLMFVIGATTFRLKTKELAVFLDAWLERPTTIPTYLKIEDVKECDYIFISHTHFDQLGGPFSAHQNVAA